jgi:hypothetical protein
LAVGRDVELFPGGGLVEDFPRVLDTDMLSPEESASALRVLEAAKEAHALDGYLFIEG